MTQLISVNLCGQSKYLCFFTGLGTLCVGYWIYRYRKRLGECDEYLKTLKWQGGGSQRYILVLGLEGAGKTRLLQCFQPASFLIKVLPTPEPTLGHVIHSVGIAGTDFHFWEVSKNGLDVGEPMEVVRSSHPVDVIIWVVDSTRPEQFAASSIALHKAVASYCNMSWVDTDCNANTLIYGVPVIVVASKQDLPGSTKPSQVYQEMHVEDLLDKHRVYVVGTQVPDSGERVGLWRLYELLAYCELKCCNYERQKNSISHSSSKEQKKYTSMMSVGDQKNTDTVL